MRPERDVTEEVLPEGSAIREVLIVDDSRLQRRIAGGLLRRWGYRVREAGSGAEALALCDEALPDLVLSDWMMPGMSGPEFCTAFRALARRALWLFHPAHRQERQGRGGGGARCRGG